MSINGVAPPFTEFILVPKKFWCRPVSDIVVDAGARPVKHSSVVVLPLLKTPAS